MVIIISVSNVSSPNERIYTKKTQNQTLSPYTNIDIRELFVSRGLRYLLIVITKLAMKKYRNKNAKDKQHIFNIHTQL